MALVSVSDDKIQITILILRRGALSRVGGVKNLSNGWSKSIMFLNFDFRDGGKKSGDLDHPLLLMVKYISIYFDHGCRDDRAFGNGADVAFIC